MNSEFAQSFSAKFYPKLSQFWLYRNDTVNGTAVSFSDTNNSDAIGHELHSLVGAGRLCLTRRGFNRRVIFSISKQMEVNHLLYIFTYFALSRNLFCTPYFIKSVGRTKDFPIWVA
jgi:hypothetical protein